MLAPSCFTSSIHVDSRPRRPQREPPVAPGAPLLLGCTPSIQVPRPTLKVCACADSWLIDGGGAQACCYVFLEGERGFPAGGHVGGIR
jgi:hypothetical protein